MNKAYMRIPTSLIGDNVNLDAESMRAFLDLPDNITVDAVSKEVAFDRDEIVIRLKGAMFPMTKPGDRLPKLNPKYELHGGRLKLIKLLYDGSSASVQLNDAARQLGRDYAAQRRILDKKYAELVLELKDEDASKSFQEAFIEMFEEQRHDQS